MSVSGWIGVDLDGTLAHYEGWNGGSIGEPVPRMLERVKRWLAEDVDVRIFTARVAGQPHPCPDPDTPCPIESQRRLIQDWTEKHLGVRLPVTHQKDFAMIELWDDRAVSVKANTGLVLGGMGRFPDGKSSEDDEGELRMAVGVRNGVLIVDFNKETGWIGFDPQSAERLAQRLLKYAQTGT